MRYLHFKSVCTQMRYSPQIAGLMPAQPLLPCKPATAVLRFSFCEIRAEEATIGRAMVLSAGGMQHDNCSGITAEPFCYWATCSSTAPGPMSWPRATMYHSITVSLSTPVWHSGLTDFTNTYSCCRWHVWSRWKFILSGLSCHFSNFEEAYF